jgi:replicative superfamily II helicase
LVQVFSTLFSSSDNALVCAPTGSGKTICAEFAILQMIAMVDAKRKEAESDDLVVVPPLKAVYVASMKLIVKQTMASWEPRFGTGGIGLKVVQLTGEQQVCFAVCWTLFCAEHLEHAPDIHLGYDNVHLAQICVVPAAHAASSADAQQQTRGDICGHVQMDLKRIADANIILATAEQWDRISRRWKQRRSISDISLFLVDELHLLGAESGPTLEVVVSRMRAISKMLAKPIRIVGFGSSIADAKDLGDWLGVPSQSLFNFPPGARAVPLEIHIHSLDIASFEARIQVRCCHHHILHSSPISGTHSAAARSWVHGEKGDRCRSRCE